MVLLGRGTYIKNKKVLFYKRWPL